MDFLADDELTLNQEDPRFKPKSERGGFSRRCLRCRFWCCNGYR